VEDGQVTGWPPSRKPHRCLKAATAAKTASVLVTFVTELTDLTGAERAGLARSTVVRTRELAGADAGSDWKSAKKTIEKAGEHRRTMVTFKMLDRLFY
jgi:hypothetical protein